MTRRTMAPPAFPSAEARYFQLLALGPDDEAEVTSEARPRHIARAAHKPDEPRDEARIDRAAA